MLARAFHKRFFVTTANERQRGLYFSLFFSRARYLKLKRIRSRKLFAVSALFVYR